MEMTKEVKMQNWYTNLLQDATLSTTEEIFKHMPKAEFSLISQKITDKKVIRRIKFHIGSKIICEATNTLQRNKLVDDWVTNHKDEPFGKIFNGEGILRVMGSKNTNSRTYVISGQISAIIEEKFFPLLSK